VSPDPRISYRVAGLAVRDGRTLLNRTPPDGFWALPGGRVEAGEAAREGLVREIREELQVDAEPGRLIWVTEHFFTYRGGPFHELEFIFAMELPPELLREGTWEATDDAGVRQLFTWAAVDKLEEIDVRPSFLRDGIPSPPLTPEHRVHYHR
jgi:ADP-ribose pyrophosphatase YjhB (NUDIX family)